MNKTKKIAMAVVATVMAGTMLLPLVGCQSKGGYQSIWKKPTTEGLEEGYKPELDDGRLKYDENIEIKTAMGYNSAVTGITYTSAQIGAVGGSNATTMVFAGKQYASGDLKPAWRYLSDSLKISVKDEWVGNGNISAGEHIKELKDNLGNYGLITASSTTIVTESANNSLLDLNKYLDFMPNYKAFLESDIVTRLSVTANTSTGAMYMIPYFDGNNDIEKYVLMRKDIVEKLLDTTDLSAATGTFKGQADAKNGSSVAGPVTINGSVSSVKPFMGNVAADNYKINVTDPAALTGTVDYGTNKHKIDDSKKYDTVELTVDYGAVISALGDNNSELYKAVAAALPSGTAVQKTSGNIVAIQNQIIDSTNGACTGAQLTKVLQEYIKVAYHKTGESTAFYTKLSEVFNSAYAAWDVDLYVALGRALMCSSALLGDSSKGDTAYMLGSRTGYTNRTYDIASMVGELYGVRGLTSRYINLYAYIDNSGNIKDARQDNAYWDALANMSALAKEGLYYTGLAAKDGYGSIASSTNSGIQIYSSTDYVQTQTRLGGFATDGKLSGVTVETGYNYAPILTPVSRWDVDGNGTAETVMRFSESWRGVKDGGLCIPKAYVKDQPQKLAAVLAIIDYMYSNDGQMVLTYGPFSAAGDVTAAQDKTLNANYGTWYGTPVDISIDKAKSDGIVDSYDDLQFYVTEKYQGLYFCYGNKLYTGTYYNGKMVPTATSASLDHLYTLNEGKFTDYARQYIGSALNFGNKDQGFEYQCTPTCGLVGADIWAIASVNGTIKHTTPGIDTNNYWYTLVPTILPFDDADINAMKDQYKTISGVGGSGANFFYANSKAEGNLLTDMMYYGYDTSKKVSGMDKFSLKADAQGMIDMLNGEGMTAVDTYMSEAWKLAKAYYATLTANK